VNILIPGGCGFVGTNLALYFTKLGHKVLCVDPIYRPENQRNYQYLRLNGIAVKECPIGDMTASYLSDGSSKPHIILNCAAQSSAVASMENPTTDFDNNVAEVVWILKLCRELDCSLIQWSSNKVYPGEYVNEFNLVEELTRFRVETTFKVSDSYNAASGLPRTIYGNSKYVAEEVIKEWARAYDLRVIINRFSCIAGPNQMASVEQGWAMRLMLAHYFDLPFTYYGWGGKQVRDVLYVGDLCRLINAQAHALLRSGSICETYDVGGGINNTISLREAATLCENITKIVVEKDNARPRPYDQHVFVSNIERISRDFAWEPRISVCNTFENLYDWIAEHERQLKYWLNL